MKLSEIVDAYVSGDWGEEFKSDENPNAVYCVRGADIVPISKNDFSNIPKRFVGNKTFKNKLLKVGDMIIEKSGGSPTQSTGRIVFVSEELIKAKETLYAPTFALRFV